MSNPQVLLTVEDMKRIVQNYFAVADDIFSDASVLNYLKLCCGRPLIFINTVFRRIVLHLETTRVVEGESDMKESGMSVDLFKTILQDGIATTLNQYRQLVKKYIVDGKRNLPNFTQTTGALMPFLLRAVVLDLKQTIVNETILEAISSGLLAISSNNCEVGQTFDIVEPLLKWPYVKLLMSNYLPILIS